MDIKNINIFINYLRRDLKFLDNLKKSNKFVSKKKEVIDPVTPLDLKIEKKIRHLINKHFRNHSIIGEEISAQNKSSHYKWVIDPIDGTKNFILGLPTWSNLIGLFNKEVSIFSLANFPDLGKCYIAYDKRCFVDYKNKKKKISCNKRANYKSAKIVINTFNTIKKKKVFKFLKEYKGLFKISGADAYNFCLIAEGKIDVLIESGLKKVDILPLLSIIKNSGAIISNWKGNLNFDKGEILITPNKKLHNYFLKKLN